MNTDFYRIKRLPPYIFEEVNRLTALADSLLEIARWRLMQETVLESVEATHAALEVLMAEGFVTQEVRLGTERIFHLNAERKAEAEDFLRSAGKEVKSKEGTE